MNLKEQLTSLCTESYDQGIVDCKTTMLEAIVKHMLKVGDIHLNLSEIETILNSIKPQPGSNNENAGAKDIRVLSKECKEGM